MVGTLGWLAATGVFFVVFELTMEPYRRLVREPNKWHPIALLTMTSAIAAQVSVIMAVVSLIAYLKS